MPLDPQIRIRIYVDGAAAPVVDVPARSSPMASSRATPRPGRRAVRSLAPGAVD